MRVNLKLKTAIKKDIGDIDSTLSRLVKPESRLALDVYRQVVDSGKRLRPLIVLYSSFACGFENRESALVLGSIVELIHTASLLHDDIIDGADYRRGRRVANAVFGTTAAVLGGDYLYSLAFNMVLDFDVEIARIISKAAYLLAEGEIKEIENSFRCDITLEEYYDVIYKKTAVLLEASSESGAVLSGGGFRDNLKNYGRYLGFAFQIKDDCLDYQSEVEKLGKDAGVDLKEGKMTLPLFYAMESHPELKNMVGEFFKAGSDDILKNIIGIVREVGLQRAIDEATLFAERAKQSIEPLRESRYKDYLMAIADYAVEREK